MVRSWDRAVGCQEVGDRPQCSDARRAPVNVEAVVNTAPKEALDAGYQLDIAVIDKPVTPGVPKFRAVNN
jgi:hypothetical protein